MYNKFCSFTHIIFERPSIDFFNAIFRACNFSEYCLKKVMRSLFLILLKIFIFIFLSAKALHAEVINEVEITGNKRTTREAIIMHGQIKIGADVSEKELNEIVENLKRINQIILKKAELKNGKLSIEIEEKWTLFPVPMITQSGSYNNSGFLIYEDNFLGTLGTLAPGLSWSNSHLNAILYFQNESLFSPNKGIKVLLLRKSEYVQFKRKEDVIDTHESRYDSVLITPNYLYKNQVFKAGPLYTNKKIVDKTGREETHDKSVGIFFRHHLNAFQALDVMYEGLVTTYDLYAIRGGNNTWYFRQEADAKWSLPVGSNFVNLGVHGHTVNDHSYLFTKILGGDEGFRGYDKSSVPSTNNMGFLAQYQQHLFESVYLTPFYEFNSTRLIQNLLNETTLNENTVGIGVRYYFKKISIPAVIFDYGRNINDKSNHFLLNIGASL